jgi:carbonic anhydrase
MSFEKLVDGFRKFQSEYFTGDETELFEKLILEGQSPETLFIACSDSRIDPGIVTNAAPGDIFSIRNVAALVPAYKPDGKEHGTSAAIEYAVDVLKVKSIIVMGHALCGGIKALAESPNDFNDHTDFIASWISVGRRARDLVRKAYPDASTDKHAPLLEQAIILVSLKNLMTFPKIKQGVIEGRIALHGWYFDIPNGKLLSYDPVEMKFKNILSGIPQAAIGIAECGCKPTTLSLTHFLKTDYAEKQKRRAGKSASSKISVQEKIPELL